MTRPLDVGLAATKLCPPTLPRRLVPRSRLGDVLDAGLADGARLVLASAPAGSGKSTLLASWLAGRAESSSWLQVEANDSDPARFWAYLIEAIGQAHPTIASALRPVVVGANGDEHVVVPALVNELAKLTEPLVVVIDDYHLIDNASVHLGMERLIDLCPQGVIVVLSTRFDPPFRLGRLRVRNQISEIRGDAFRFNPLEASGLLSSGAELVDETVVEKLCERTEGWAAGLVLAGLSLRRSPNPEQFIEDFHGDDQLVVDYMTDEFLAGVGDEHRRRLLETSVLEQFNGALVDAVSGGTDGATWLRDTAQVNQLLIGLDRTGSWYRYHHLLRDLLRLEAQQAFPDRLSELHQRAGDWFESEGDLGQAVGHQLAAGDREKAGRLMFAYGSMLIADGQFDTLRGVLEKVGDVAKTMAWCTLAWGWCEFMAGRYSLAEAWVEATHDVASDEFDQTITASLRMNICLGRGDLASALAIAGDLARSGRFESNTSDLATVAGGVYMWAGQVDEARLALDLASRKSADEQFKSTHLLSLIYRAINEFDAGNREAAGATATVAIDTADGWGMASYHRIGPAYAIRARTAADLAGARADALHGLELTRRMTDDLMLGYVLTICGDTLLDLGDADGPALLTEARSVINRCPDPGIAGRHLARVESRHSIAEVNSARVEVLVEQLTERETAVLRYLPTKMSQREIASELYVSLNTVKTHCSAIYRKLAVDNRKAAVQAARDLSLL
jgi:LuxR family maltose regulon positive regulatory protein